jgi:hypothetical protein
MKTVFVYSIVSRLPLARRHRRVVIERKDQLVVGVNHVNHDPVILGKMRIAGDDEFVSDVDRAAERGFLVAERDAWRRQRRRWRIFTAARGKPARHHDERGDAERKRLARETTNHDTCR